MSAGAIVPPFPGQGSGFRGGEVGGGGEERGAGSGRAPICDQTTTSSLIFSSDVMTEVEKSKKPIEDITLLTPRSSIDVGGDCANDSGKGEATKAGRASLATEELPLSYAGATRGARQALGSQGPKVETQYLVEKVVKETTYQELIEKAKKGRNEFSISTGAAKLKQEELAVILFEELGITNDELVSVNAGALGSGKTVVQLKEGVSVSKYVKEFEFNGIKMGVATEGRKIVTAKFSNVPSYIPNEELLNIVSYYGVVVDWVVRIPLGNPGGRLENTSLPDTRFIQMELGTDPVPNYFWLEGPLGSDHGVRVSLSYPGQLPQCYHCLSSATVCPGQGWGKQCKALGKIGKTSMNKYMRVLNTNGFFTLKQGHVKKQKEIIKEKQDSISGKEQVPPPPPPPQPLDLQGEVESLRKERNTSVNTNVELAVSKNGHQNDCATGAKLPPPPPISKNPANTAGKNPNSAPIEGSNEFDQMWQVQTNKNRKKKNKNESSHDDYNAMYASTDNRKRSSKNSSVNPKNDIFLKSPKFENSYRGENLEVNLLSGCTPTLVSVSMKGETGEQSVSLGSPIPPGSFIYPEVNLIEGLKEDITPSPKGNKSVQDTTVECNHIQNSKRKNRGSGSPEELGKVTRSRSAATSERICFDISGRP